ncbi:unnamed protein product [Phytomonas sp. Hart1]|nr:unnamed protein product [Phytomonas sp. Hart1]|eukprot:CCW67340.1 unnamed protein product [Phytomonas sp. isolate Hart1]
MQDRQPLSFPLFHAHNSNKGVYDTDADESELADTDSSPHELVTLILEGSRVGCAKYSPYTCIVEVFEAGALFGVGSGSRCRTGITGKGTNQRILPVLTQDDIPSSLLWLVRILETHRPLIFLPSEGSEPLAEICHLLGFIPSHLSRTSAFNPNDVIPQLLRMYPHLTTEEISSRFNFNHKAMLSAMSALLRYTSLVQSNIHNIVERMPYGIMYIDAAAIQWLQLTRTERHPCAYQGIGQPKEGLSLFSVVNQTVTAFGRALLRQWFALPSCDLDELQQRQQVVQYFSAVCCRETQQQIRSALKKLHPTDPIFTLMRRGKATLRHYRLLLQTMHGLIALHTLLLPIAHEVNFLRNLMNSFNMESIQNMASTLENSIFCILQLTQINRDRNYRRNSTTDGQRGDNFLYNVAYMVNRDHCKVDCYAVTLQWGVDGVLDELREHYAYLPSILEQKAKESEQELLRDMGKTDAYIRRALCTLRCTQIGTLGYVLSLNEEAFLSCLLQSSGVGKERATYFEESLRGSSPHPPRTLSVNNDNPYLTSLSSDGDVLNQFCLKYNWEYVQTSEGLLHFKTSKMKELDAYVGDLLQRMIMRENDVRRELEEELLRCSLDLLKPARPLAELDCLLSFAYCATEFQWVCPRLVRKRGLVHIVDGWHPLLQQVLRGNELVPFTFIANDTSEQVCVVAGESGSGKSALISAIAQIIILAQLGSFVPSREATLGLFSYIITCNSTGMVPEQLSSFQSECLQVNRMLRHCAYERITAAATFHEATKEPLKGCREKNDKCEDKNIVMDDTSRPCGNTTVSGLSTEPEHHLTGTLILIDDIGRGTTPHDAMALLGAVLRYLVGLKVSDSYADLTENVDGCISDTHVGYLHDISEVLCPTVLCATRFYELMEVGQQYINNTKMNTTVPSDRNTDKNDESLRSELLRFPFERITFYNLPCLAVYPDQKRTQSSFMKHGASEEEVVCVEDISYSHQHKTEKVTTFELPIDVVPTYQPCRVTLGSDQYGKRYNFRKECCLYGGVAMAQRHNLLLSLLLYWKEGLKIMSSFSQQ